MKRIICVLCVALGALTLAASASARAPHHPSTLSFVASDPPVDDTIFVVGAVSSPSQKCVPNRTVKISYDYGNGFVPVDVATSSQSGFFVGAGPAFDGGNLAANAKLKLLETTFRKRGQKHVCDGDKLVV